jgi:hypothetical protein
MLRWACTMFALRCESIDLALPLECVEKWCSFAGVEFDPERSYRGTLLIRNTLLVGPHSSPTSQGPMVVLPLSPSPPLPLSRWCERSSGDLRILSTEGRGVRLQGYLARKETPTPLGPP